MLLVNAGETGVTTAIVRDGILLLHRTVDLAAAGLEERMQAVVAAEILAHPAAQMEVPVELLAAPHHEQAGGFEMVDAEDSAGEWAMQKPLSGYGVIDDEELARAREKGSWNEDVQSVMDLEEEAAKLRAEIEAEALAEIEVPLVGETRVTEEQRMTAAAREVTQAVSVAAAYFEDTLEMAPGLVMAAGTMGAELLGSLLRDAGFGQEEIRVMEMVDPAMLTGGATTSRVPRGWMAGVRGALRS